MNASSQSLPVVLVTGSSGLVGEQLVRALAGRYRVVGLDLARPTRPVQGFEWVHCDLSKQGTVARALERVRNEFGSHLASAVHLVTFFELSGQPDPRYGELTINGTRRLVDALRSFEVEQAVFLSSIRVFKPAEGRLLDESSPVEDAWSYPLSLLAAEHVLQARCENAPVVIVRGASVYDDWCRNEALAGQILRIYEQRRDSHVSTGDAEHGQPYIHRDDLVDCLVRIVDRRAELAWREMFLVAEADLLGYATIQDRIGELLYGVELWPTVRIPKPFARLGAWVQEVFSSYHERPLNPEMIEWADANYPVNIHRAKEVLDWEPQRSLWRALEVMTARLKEDPDEWYLKNHWMHPTERRLDAVVVDPDERF